MPAVSEGKYLNAQYQLGTTSTIFTHGCNRGQSAYSSAHAGGADDPDDQSIVFRAYCYAAPGLAAGSRHAERERRRCSSAQLPRVQVPRTLLRPDVQVGCEPMPCLFVSSVSVCIFLA
jgi:hypothetical protein